MTISKYTILKEFEQNLLIIENMIGINEIDNITLNSLGKYLFGSKFKGVYSANDKFKMRHGQLAIINTDPNYKSGMHWCALAKHKNRIYYYDSFSGDKNKLSKFWINKNWIKCNNDVDQADSVKCCGMLFLFVGLYLFQNMDQK